MSYVESAGWLMSSLLGVLCRVCWVSYLYLCVTVMKPSLFVSSMPHNILYVLIKSLLLRYAKHGKLRCFSLSMCSKYLSFGTSFVALRCTFSSALMYIA